MNKHFKAETIREAWEIVNNYFPSDYMKDEESSERAGYPIYRSTVDNEKAYYNYICDLGDRLEINLVDENWKSTTINVWVEDMKSKLLNELRANTMKFYGIC